MYILVLFIHVEFSSKLSLSHRINIQIVLFIHVREERVHTRKSGNRPFLSRL